MKGPCEFLVDDIVRLIEAEFRQRKEKLTQPDLSLKLALIAKIGIIHESHGHPVPSGGTMEVAASQVVARYLFRDDPVVTALLQLTPAQLRQRVKELCAGQPGG